jgi:hypothetical protein
MEHHNAYGLQGGIDPFTETQGEKGETFARESGSNTYKITVKNEGPGEAGSGRYSAGDTLRCVAVESKGVTSVEYRWLRNGEAIPGETGGTYTLKSADEGKAIQCQVTVSGREAKTLAVSLGSSLVLPLPSTLPPAGGSVLLTGVGQQAEVGGMLTCSTAWTSGSPTSFEYQWLRDGGAIAGATMITSETHATYTPGSEDAGKVIQCRVTAKNAGGSAVAINHAVEDMAVPPATEGGGALPPAVPTAVALIPAATVVDELPEGFVVASPEPEQAVSGAGWNCNIATNAGAVECFALEPLPEGASYKPITLRVAVNPQAANPSINRPSVSGGDAVPAETTEEKGKTTVTAAVPFGIDRFTTSAVESLGSPFGQAGGHMFSDSTETVFNYTPTSHFFASPTEKAFVAVAGGAPKSVEVALPPGFSGNPQSVPRCPIQSMRTAICPARTAVGYIELALGQFEIVGGQVQPLAEGSVHVQRTLVFNMQPTPGYPAAFGFIYEDAGIATPIELEVEVRSDGDYGVTVGDRAGGNGSIVAELLATKATFCENGATATQGATSEQKVRKVASCNPVTPGSKPFLRNPTECASSEPGTTAAPVTTVQASPWDEPKPALFASMEAYANAPSGPYSEVNHLPTHGTPLASSLMSGCDLLQFQPEIGFKPSAASEGGTSQADEPTGVTVDLKVPQSSEAAPSATKGQTLVCLRGSWEGSPTGYSYEWLRGGAEIPGETSRTYTLKSADEGKAIQCQVTAKNGGGGAAAVSIPLAVPPLPATPVPVAPTSITAPTGAGLAGEALKCVPGTWTGGSASPPYQWLRNGVAIAGATSAEYTVQAGDVPSVLQCEVTVSNAGGAVSAVSANKETAPKPAPTPPARTTTLPGISGESASPATPDLKNVVMTLPAGMTVSPSAANGLQACSNAQFGLGTEFGPGSAHTEPAKPASCPLASQIGTVEVFTPLLSGEPTIEGVPYKGEELTCSQGMWTRGTWNVSQKELEEEGLSFSYQWLRGVEWKGKPFEEIKGATGSEYRLPSEGPLVKEDEGKAIQCRVTATNASGSSVAVSRDAVVLEGGHVIAVGANEPSNPPPFPPSSIAAPSGTASAGNTLTCAAGAWTGNPTFAYRWLRGGAAIPGASAETETYTLTPEDTGKVIQCQVTGTNGGGNTIADSAAVIASPVPSPPPPLPGAPVQGQVFVGEPECSPCTNEDAEDGKLFRLFLQVQDPSAGVILKLHGTTSANKETGRLTTTFVEQPQQPFELLRLKLKGGPRATLANPQSCGLATTTADLTPWSAPGLGGVSGTEAIPGTADAHPTSEFNVEGCSATPLFNPSFNAGTTGAGATTADAPTDFSVTFGREDREQDLSGVTVHMPPGLTGKIAGIPLCGEAQANAGTCGPQSEIGTATSLSGPGPDPFPETGHAYLTGPYKGAPFGLSVVTPAVAGPFNLGNVVVRSAISIDPHTAAVTVTSDPLPQFVDGVQLRLRKVNVNVNRPGFMLNPTNCSAQQVSATLGSAQGASAQVSSPFGIGGCTSLPFKPTFTASTQAHASKAGGESLNVKVTYPPGAYANIAKTLTELPAALPSRLTTLQKACVDTVFEANPAACPEGSVVGYSTAHTPLLNVPLSGPAYLVSHGGAAFPDLEVVLQGEGVEVILDGQSDIKKGVTITTFNALPDSPVSTFELNLPEGPHSALAANGNLCTTPLNLPTTLTGQNGAVIKQTTHIAVIGCPPTVSIAKAKLSGNALLVTVKTSAKGTVKISGQGLKTVKRNLTAGTHRIRVALTKLGISRHKHHKKISVRVNLTVGKQQAVAKTATVRL